MEGEPQALQGSGLPPLGENMFHLMVWSGEGAGTGTEEREGIQKW